MLQPVDLFGPEERLVDRGRVCVVVHSVGTQHLIDQAVISQTAVAVLTVDRVDDGDFPELGADGLTAGHLAVVKVDGIRNRPLIRRTSASSWAKRSSQ